MSLDFSPGPVEASMRARAVAARRRLFGGNAPLRIEPPAVKTQPVYVAPAPVDLTDYDRVVAQVDEAIDGEPRKITCRQIIAEVCFARGVHPRDLMSMSRSRPIVAVRQECCWRMRNEVTILGRQISLPEIGRHLGGLDHTTVLHSIRKFDAMRAA